MAVDLKQLSRGILEEAFGKGRIDYVDQVCDPSCKSHDPLLGELDVEAFKRSIESYRTAFPDMKPTILAVCAEGDLVAIHWRVTGTHKGPLEGIPATGKRATVEGMGFDRYRGGKLVESFAQWDTLGFMQQLGVVPRIEAAASGGGAAQPQPQPRR